MILNVFLFPEKTCFSCFGWAWRLPDVGWVLRDGNPAGLFYQMFGRIFEKPIIAKSILVIIWWSPWNQKFAAFTMWNPYSTVHIRICTHSTKRKPILWRKELRIQSKMRFIQSSSVLDHGKPAADGKRIPETCTRWNNWRRQLVRDQVGWLPMLTYLLSCGACAPRAAPSNRNNLIFWRVETGWMLRQDRYNRPATCTWAPLLQERP